jgi:inorganic pyrophosphatase
VLLTPKQHQKVLEEMVYPADYYLFHNSLLDSHKYVDGNEVDNKYFLGNSLLDNIE